MFENVLYIMYGVTVKIDKKNETQNNSHADDVCGNYLKTYVRIVKTNRTKSYM